MKKIIAFLLLAILGGCCPICHRGVQFGHDPFGPAYKRPEDVFCHNYACYMPSELNQR